MTTARLTVLTALFMACIVAVAGLLATVLVGLPVGLAALLAAFAAARSCRSRIDAATVGPSLVRLLQAGVLAGLAGLWIGVLVWPDHTGPLAGCTAAAGLGAWLGVVWAMRPVVAVEEGR